MILPKFTAETTIIGESEVGKRIQGEIVGRLDKPDLVTYSRRNSRRNTYAIYWN